MLFSQAMVSLKFVISFFGNNYCQQWHITLRPAFRYEVLPYGALGRCYEKSFLFYM